MIIFYLIQINSTFLLLHWIHYMVFFIFLNKNDANFQKTKNKIWKNLKNEIKLNLLYEYKSDEIEVVMEQLDHIRKKFEEKSSKIRDLNRCKDKTNKYLNIFDFNSLD